MAIWILALLSAAHAEPPSQCHCVMNGTTHTIVYPQPLQDPLWLAQPDAWNSCVRMAHEAESEAIERARQARRIAELETPYSGSAVPVEVTDLPEPRTVREPPPLWVAAVAAIGGATVGASVVAMLK